MNSIPAGVRGVVRAVLVTNADYVEYGQPIMVVEPRA
jgi:biotin carboxyl carrier protein